MNVGITRARASVLVVGSGDTLKTDKHWKNLIASAEERNLLFKVSKPYTEFFSESSLESMLAEEAVGEVFGDDEMDAVGGDDYFGDDGGVVAAGGDDDYGDDGGGGDDGAMDDS